MYILYKENEAYILLHFSITYLHVYKCLIIIIYF